MAPLALQVAGLKSPFGGHGSRPLILREAGGLAGRVRQVKNRADEAKGPEKPPDERHDKAKLNDILREHGVAT